MHPARSRGASAGVTGLHVTRRRSGTGRPAVAADGGSGDHCPNQLLQDPLSPVLDGRAVGKGRSLYPKGLRRRRPYRKPLRPFGYRLLNEAASRWERLRTRSSPHGLNNSRPSPAGGPARPLPGTKAIRRANFRLGHAGRRGSDRFGLLDLRVFSTFLNILRAICSDHGYPT